MLFILFFRFFVFLAHYEASNKCRYHKCYYSSHGCPSVPWAEDRTRFAEKYRAEYPNRMDRDQFPIGTEVEILYDVSDPLRFHLDADPVFTDPGGGAIRLSILWIVACAVLTLLLAVFVGGLQIDVRSLWYRIRLLFHQLKR